MSVVLLIVGILLAGAGLAAGGFGVLFNELNLGATLILAGTTALCGGLVLVGLAAVVTELRRVSEGLRVKPIARPGRPTEAEGVPGALPAIAAPPPATRPRPEVRESRPVEPPLPQPATAVDVSAAAIERLRSSIPRVERPEPSVVAEGEHVPLSPNGGGHPSATPRAPGVAAPPEPRVTAEDRPGGAAVETVKASRLDFLFRSRPARPLQPQNFDSTWPSDGRPAPGKAREAEPRLDDRPPAPPLAAPAPPPVAADAAPRRAEPVPSPAATEAPPTAAILKSGVVDGMAYTLYADGSIEAKLPHGTVRFGSIAELRAHIESNS